MGIGKLTERQRRFVEAYMVSGNAKQAAIAAGFSKNDRTAEVEGSRQLRKAEVAAEVARRRERLAKRYEISAERVLEQYARIAFARVTDFMTFGPTGVRVRAGKDLSDDQIDGIAEVKERLSKGKRQVSVRLHSKTDALAALGKHLGLFVEKHEHDISARLSDALTQIKSRLSPAAQEELVRAVGEHLAESVASSADDAAAEPSGEA